MARPQKNSCDYFPHDADMRNHRKIKAIRNKFGNAGFAVWVMFLEYLTDQEGNQSEYADLEFELLSGDFNTEPEQIKEIIDYCLQLGLLQLEDDFVRSKSLDDRLAPVYQKRDRMRQISQLRIEKLNEKKAEQSKKPAPKPAPEKEEVVDLTNQINIDFDFFWNEYDKKVGDKAKLKKKWERLTDKERQAIMDYIPPYKEAQPDKAFRKNPETFLNNKSWNDEIIKPELRHSDKKQVSEKFTNANAIIDAMFDQQKSN